MSDSSYESMMYEAQRRALAAEARIAQMEATLREIITLLTPMPNPSPLDPYWESSCAIEAARAALEERYPEETP